MLNPEVGPHDLPSARLRNVILAITMNIDTADPDGVNVADLRDDLSVLTEIALALKAGRWSDGIPL